MRNRAAEIKQICEREVYSGPFWADIITNDSIGIIEECAALTTPIATGSIPFTKGNSYGFVFKEPLGVILGIAPWNAPVILGFRAVIAPIAAGNVAILKGSPSLFFEDLPNSNFCSFSSVVSHPLFRLHWF